MPLKLVPPSSLGCAAAIEANCECLCWSERGGSLDGIAPQTADKSTRRRRTQSGDEQA